MRIKSNCEAISTDRTRINPKIILNGKTAIRKVVILKLTRVMYSFEVSIMSKTIIYVYKKYFYRLCNRFMKNKAKYSLSWCFHHQTLKTPIPVYIQQEATLHGLFYLETALHVSGGKTTHHQERKQMYLQHLVFVIPSLLPAAIGMTNTRCCRYSCLGS
jgi:hypothetical protein